MVLMGKANFEEPGEVDIDSAPYAKVFFSLSSLVHSLFLCHGSDSAKGVTIFHEV